MVNQDPSGNFYLENHHEKTISKLIDWHRRTKTPLSASSSAVLRRPVVRTAWFLSHDSIKLDDKLAEGVFGDVFHGQLSSGNDKQEEVTVTTLHTGATRATRLMFMKGARMLRKFSHQHVIKLLGIAVHELPLMLVMEACPGGSLVSYLRENKGKMDAATKLRFSTEAADGLWYIEKQICIHRDIAARNCFIGSNNEIKIAEFGMADHKKVVHDDTLEKVPTKWLAPESLQEKIYSLKTDVWSYGVLVWEIYSEGTEPYPGLTKKQARAKIVVDNFRMEMPKDTPAIVAKMVYACWDKSPNARPDMGEIFRTFMDLKDR